MLGLGEHMQFCPKCGKLMLPKKIGEGVVLACSSCDYTAEGGELEEYKVVKKSRPEEEITVIEEGKEQALPTAKVSCSSCGHGTAYWWLRQTRAGDEPTTRFYRCVKCGKVWREYS